MNAEECADAVIEGLKAKARPAVASLASELRDEVREEIGVPVGRSGSKVIRSKPGEPPRKETGTYSGSWQDEVSESGDVITGHAFTTSKIGGYLVNGTSRMEPRPHAEKVAARARENGGARIQSKL